MTAPKVFTFAAIIILFGCISAQAQHNSIPTSAASTFLSPSKSTTVSSYNPSFPKLSQQFGAGLLIGGVGGGLAGLAGVALAPNSGGDSGAGFAAMGYAAIGVTVGYTFGSALGIYAAANTPSYTPSYGKILIGTTLGTMAGLGTIAIIGPNTSVTGGAIVAVITPIVGGMIANSLSIHKNPGYSSALLNISEGKPTLSAPSVQLRNAGNIDISQHRSATVKLLNISL